MIDLRGLQLQRLMAALDHANAVVRKSPIP